jgi:hypothetical protein
MTSPKQPSQPEPTKPSLPAPQEVLDEAVAAARQCYAKKPAPKNESKYRYPAVGYALDIAEAIGTRAGIFNKDPKPAPKPPAQTAEQCIHEKVDEVIGKPGNSVGNVEQLQQIRDYVTTKVAPKLGR